MSLRIDGGIWKLSYGSDQTMTTGKDGLRKEHRMLLDRLEAGDRLIRTGEVWSLLAACVVVKAEVVAFLQGEGFLAPCGDALPCFEADLSQTWQFSKLTSY